MTDNNQHENYVFISYSRKDHAVVERLRTDLKSNEIDYWFDQEDIQPGASNWERTIRKAIQDASTVIFIVSPNSLDSNAVQGEIALAKLYDLTIYPVWVEGENFMECIPLEMSRAQYIDMRGESYIIGIAQLLDAIKQRNVERAYTPQKVQPLPEGKEPRNPYKGLRAFREADAGDFFGREKLVSELVEIVRSRMTASERLVALIGPSGSGKSSVVMAGLLPKLKQGAIPGSEKWVYLEPFTPGKDPLERLGFALMKKEPPNFSAVRKELETSSGLGLMKIAQDLVQPEQGQYLVVYIDQFEELFTQVEDEHDRERFINNIVAAATRPDSPVIVVLTLRADFYDRPMNYNHLADLIQNNNRSVLPLTLSEVTAAITKPAELDDVQLEFEGELAAEIVFDLLEFRVPHERTTSLAGALPLLQFALSRLYDLRDGNRLTMSAYKDMGRVDGAIGYHAEEEFKKISEIREEILNRLFYYLVNIDEQGIPTRRRSPRTLIVQDDTDANRLVDLLIENRLLVADQERQPGEADDGAAAGDDEEKKAEVVLEVAHEALLRSWDRLARWIAQNSVHIQWLQKVQNAALEWERDGKKDHRLWRYEDLQPVYEAMSAFEPMNIQFDPVLQEFVRPQMDRLLEDFERTPEYRQMGIVDRWREIGTDAAPQLVRALLYAKSEEVVNAIDHALWQEAHAAEQALIAALNDESEDLRDVTAQAIGRLGVVNAVDALIANVTNPAFKNNLPELEALYVLVDVVENKKQVEKPLLQIIPAASNRTLEERCAAARVVGCLASYRDDEAVQCLIEELSDSRWEMREQVAYALGQTSAHKAVDALSKTARYDSTAHVRKAAALALGQIGLRKAMLTLIDAAVDRREEVRKAAVQGLVSVDAENAISMLTFRLRDDMNTVRQATAEELGKAAHPYAVRPLMDALDSEEYIPARVAIVNALASYADRYDVAPVLRKTLKYTENPPTVRAAAARALSKMREQRNANIRDLLKVLDEKKLPPEVKVAVIWALGQLQTKDAVKPLMKELSSTRRWQTRFEAAEALANIGDASIASDLRKILEGKDSDAVFAAAVALAGLNGSSGENMEPVKDELVNALGDPRLEVRCIAASSLGKLQDVQTLPRLLEALSNRNQAVREAAASAIHRMDTSSIRDELNALLKHPFLGVRQAAQMAR